MTDPCPDPQAGMLATFRKGERLFSIPIAVVDLKNRTLKFDGDLPAWIDDEGTVVSWAWQA